MLVTIGTIVGAWFATLLISTVLATMLGAGTIAKGIIQVLAATATGIALLYGGHLSLVGVGVFVGAVVALKAIIALLFIVYFYQALQGELGEETKWASELAKDGDDEFIKAMTSLPSQELKEVSIIAESKSELRELTVERSEEYNE